MAWRLFVESAGKPSFAEVIPNFDNIKRAFQARNELVHGQSGTTGIDRASDNVLFVIEAIKGVTELSLSYRVDLEKQLWLDVV